MNELRMSSPGGADGSDEMLNVRDVVALLRDFLRAKALTESEISREVPTMNVKLPTSF